MWKYKNIIITNFMFFIATVFYFLVISKTKELEGLELEVIFHDYTYMFTLSIVIFSQTDKFMQKDLLLPRFSNVLKFIKFSFFEISKKILIFFALFFIELCFMIVFISHDLCLMKFMNIFLRILILSIAHLGFFLLIITGKSYHIRRNTSITIIIWNLCILEIILLGTNSTLTLINPLSIVYSFDFLSIIRFVIVMSIIMVHIVYKVINKGKLILDERK